MPDNNNNYEQLQQKGNDVACTLPFDCTIEPESIQQLRMRYTMANRVTERQAGRCTTKAPKAQTQTYRTRLARQATAHIDPKNTLQLQQIDYIILLSYFYLYLKF